MNFFKAIDYRPDLVQDIRTVVLDNAVTHLKNVPDSTDLESYYVELAEAIGYLVRQDEDPETAEIKDKAWTRIKYKKEKSETAYKYSNNRHPMHTDYCYFPIDMDITFFYCEKQADEGGETVFLDSEVLLCLLKETNPELLQQLESRMVRFGRGKSRFSTKQAKVITYDSKGVKFHWSFPRVSEENPAEVIQMAKDFSDFLNEKIMDEGRVEPVLLKRGEAVFIQDKRVLHGRNAYNGERWLMKAPIITGKVDVFKAKIGEFVRKRF